MTDGELRAEVQRLRALGDRRERDFQAMAAGLEAFVTHAVHDIRSSLGVIGSYAGLLHKRHAAQLDPQAQEFVQAIRSGSKRVAQQVDGWRGFSRLLSQPLQPQAVDMAPLAAEAAEQLQADGAAPHRPHVDIGALPAVTGDPRLLRVLWQHLLSNAVKFTRNTAQARIEVRGEELGANAAYSVADNGAGFDMKDAARLFLPFGRLHEEREYAGTGIGLALVQEIARRHGGRAWAEAAPGRGATFHVELPRGEGGA